MQNNSNANNSNSNAQVNSAATQAQYNNYAALYCSCVANNTAKAATQATQATTTKKAQVIAMLQQQHGTTVLQIASKLNISKVAARSLIGDVRAAKLRVTCVNNIYKLA